MTMSKREKEQFIKDLIGSVQTTILGKLDQIPEDWDGYELRLYIRDKFADVVWGDVDGRSSRVRNYNNDVIVKNL